MANPVLTSYRVATPRRVAPILTLLVVVAIIVLAAALMTGSVAVDASTVWRALAGNAPDANAAIVRDLRLPRAMAAFATGGLLALAGALMQVLLRNPLADPYILGLSGGAAVASLSALLLGFAALAAPAAFFGAFASTLIVFALARSGERTPWTASRLLLTGVVVAAGWGAMISLLLTLAADAQVKGMLFWLIGDLSGATRAVPALLTLAFVLFAALALARDLNVLARGEDTAAALGVAVPRLTLALHALAALATAAAVTTAGSVGFVGLIVPHALRLAVGNDQRLLLPASALAGGALLVLADTLARTVAAPLQLPVGVITALVGVPVFLWLLSRSRS
jgi:iron complex transport system permease protein